MCEPGLERPVLTIRCSRNHFTQMLRRAVADGISPTVGRREEKGRMWEPGFCKNPVPAPSGKNFHMAGGRSG